MAYSFLDLAADVLKKTDKPLTYQQLWQAGVEMGLAAKLQTVGKTPWQSIGAQLYVDVRDNDDSKFIKVGKRPAKFFLKGRSKEITEALTEKIEQIEEKKTEKLIGYKERDLHSILTYFVFASPTFNRGRAIVTKTINHQSSKKSGYKRTSRCTLPSC